VEWRFVRLSRPWGAVAAIMAGAALTLLGGWQAMVATLACAGGVLALALQGARRLEQPGRAVQRATGALREVAMLGSAAAELRCFALEDWAAARVAASDRLAEAQNQQAAVAARFEALHATGVAVAAASALMLSLDAGAPVAALAALAAAMTVDGLAPILRASTEGGGCARRRRGWMPSSMRRRTHVPLSDRAARRSSSSMATGSYRAAGSR
jgi:ATP-binding cassette subfamily C protein CydC